MLSLNITPKMSLHVHEHTFSLKYILPMCMLMCMYLWVHNKAVYTIYTCVYTYMCCTPMGQILAMKVLYFFIKA